MNEQEQRPTEQQSAAPQQPAAPTPAAPAPKPASTIGNAAGSALSSIQADQDLQKAKAMLTDLITSNLVPMVLAAATFAAFAIWGMGSTNALIMTIIYDFLFCRLQLIPKYGREHDQLLDKIRLHNQRGGSKLSLNESFYQHFTDKQVNILRMFFLAIMVAPFILSTLFMSIIPTSSMSSGFIKFLRIIVNVVMIVGSVLTAAFYCNNNSELKHINDTYDASKMKNSGLRGEFTEEELPFIIQE